MKTIKNRTIGLVLPSVPGYSETFFKNKINGLQQNGAKVIVFVANSTKAKHKLTYEVRYAPKLNGNIISVVMNSVIELLKAFLFNYKNSVRYLNLEKNEGTPLKFRIKKLIANNFILCKKTDWLHFGFGTMALGRENINKITGAKMAVSFRGFDIGIYPLKHPNCYNELFKKVDKIHIISDDIAELLYKQGLEDKTIITKITPAIDTAFFVQSAKTKNIPLHFLTIGRLHWKKGFEYTLEALSILKKQGIDFNYTIIGDGIEKERLIFAVHQLGLSENVNFLGKLTHEEVKKELEQTDLYLQYSLQEGFCNAVLEAQAMGLLCIVSDAEGLSENVLHNETGWVVPKRSPELLAQKIKEVIEMDAVQKEIIISKAVQRVKDEFNIKKQTQEFVAFYKL